MDENMKKYQALHDIMMQHNARGELSHAQKLAQTLLKVGAFQSWRLVSLH